jgi:peptidoglycan/LPS O-acetylase OafA/YrhL
MSNTVQSVIRSAVEVPASTPDCSGAASGQQRFQYVPALDGLRGLAVVVVMIYHAAPELLPGGFLGVELFFVLSGFLITSLLLKEHDRSGIQLGRFYMRRALRLTPALIVMLASVVLLSWVALSGDAFRNTVSDAAFSLTYIFNWVRASDPGRSSFLGHTWSLCIEEQFYLLWPLLLPAITMIGRRDRLTERLLVAVAAIVLWRMVLSNFASPMRIYNGLDTRADGLLLGCALGAAIHDGRLRFETLATKLETGRSRAVLRGGFAVALLCRAMVRTVDFSLLAASDRPAFGDADLQRDGQCRLVPVPSNGLASKPASDVSGKVVLRTLPVALSRFPCHECCRCISNGSHPGWVRHRTRPGDCLLVSR